MPATRRAFLGSLTSASVALLGLPATVRSRPLAPGDLAVDGARLRQELEALSGFGRVAGGSFSDGVTRLGYSEADAAGRAYVMGLMRGVGLTPRVDPAGNLFASRAGRNPALAPILFGSHIDSVPQGGNFDGDLGSLAAIEAVRVLEARGVRTEHPLEVVVWANEEGGAYQPSLSGSRAVAGQLRPDELDLVIDGVSKAEAIGRIGGDAARIAEARREPGWFHAYLELHIEQGATLEEQATAIGVVQGIVTIDRYAVTVEGFANHAGTTPMDRRQDALLAASHVTLAVNEVVRAASGRQVGTVGRLEVTPNAPNVVPGRVDLTVELRDLDAGKLVRLARTIEERAREIARATGTAIQFSQTTHNEGAVADPRVQDVVEGAAAALGLSSLRLPSGAGHDAQMMGRLGPMGMIFVPSVGGVSHSPRELTSWDDCTRGADVLLRAVLALDATPLGTG